MPKPLNRNLCISLLVVLLAACSTTRFYPHEARENEHLGKGGSRFTVEGIDVWFNGEPPRTYAILGYIEDPRGLYGDENRRTIESGVLQKAREINADALIEIVLPGRSAPSSTITMGTGFGHPGIGMGFGFGIPGPERISVKYTAIRYLDKN